MSGRVGCGGMRVVGLIGPIGAGKSVVADELARCGATVIKADEVSREVMAPGSETLARVQAAFGPEYVDERGELKRRELGQAVFADALARRRLEEIVHPAMVARIEEKLAELRASPQPPQMVVIEAANLVEMGGGRLVDKLVMVTAPRAERLRRIIGRGGLSPEEAEQRVRAHEELGIEEHSADYVVMTNGDEEDTRRRARRLWQELADGVTCAPE